MKTGPDAVVPSGRDRPRSSRNRSKDEGGKRRLKVPPPVPDAAFPVVGIGASAGGLEAFTRILKRLPPDTGMAFVLIQHLDPKHKSALAHILARETRMAVAEVADGMPVRSDHVYVIPPNASMRLTDGHFEIARRERSNRVPLPIDTFFRSLSALSARRAIFGVVLSGSGSDGTLGLEAIKGEGGVTFAQDEGSAKFPDMPRSAIAAGVADIVLDPEGIAD